jgi:diaminopropionate ammonia-lyase
MPEWKSLDDLAELLAPLRPLDLATATDATTAGRWPAAHLVGLGARIFVPAGTHRCRIDAIRSEEASCGVVDGSYDDAVARAAEASDSQVGAASSSPHSWPGCDVVPAWVIDGYSTIFAEIEAARGRGPAVARRGARCRSRSGPSRQLRSAAGPVWPIRPC